MLLRMAKPVSPLISRRIVASIEDLPFDVWDSYVALEHPFRSSAFFAAVETSLQTRQYAYMLLERGSEPVGVAALSQEDYDLTLLLPAAIGKLVQYLRRYFPRFLRLRLAMTGVMETAMHHWWWKPSVLDADGFAGHLLSAFEEAFPHAHLFLVRDFMAGRKGDEMLKAALIERRFRLARNLPLAVVDLVPGGINAHLGRLRGKAKAAIRNQIAVAERLDLRLDRLHDYSHLIDSCYPLYLQVHNAAREFKREALPKKFFSEVAHRFSGRSTLLVARARGGQLVGCVLTGFSDTVSNPFLIGLDYSRAKELGLYYNLIWAEICDAAEASRRVVDLGVTSYFIKQTMGAKLKSMTMVLRLRSRWMQRLFGGVVAGILSADEPATRRAFRVQAKK